ncbi:MAG: hemerythrin domain-containing protein [Myxococcales bacterium]|nr:hemerythrin domain-containing protein [Myxococcales bacterium]
MDMRKLAEDDPLIRNVEKDPGGEELSPMDPPDAFEPPAKEAVPYEQLHPFLKRLVDDHRRIVERLDALDATVAKVEAGGLSAEAAAALTEVFAFIEAELAVHHRREERRLFPLLRERLIAVGEHSASEAKRTGVDVMEDDHLTAVKQAAVAIGFVGLSSRLPDRKSGLIALASGVRQCKALSEALRLHIFREENIIFGQAQKHLSRPELDQLAVEQG